MRLLRPYLHRETHGYVNRLSFLHVVAMLVAYSLLRIRRKYCDAESMITSRMAFRTELLKKVTCSY